MISFVRFRRADLLYYRYVSMLDSHQNDAAPQQRFKPCLRLQAPVEIAERNNDIGAVL
jgi:hypothetical protein